jgi:hypothetical protein
MSRRWEARGASSYIPTLFLAGNDVPVRERSVVPVSELWTLYVQEAPRQLTKE